MSSRTENILLAAVLILLILGMILIPRAEWYRELRRLVPPAWYWY